MTRYGHELRVRHLPTIKEFCEDMGLKYVFIHGFEWHIRIANIMDVFPTHNKWHWLPTGERGRFEDYDDLGKIFTERIEV